MEKSVWLAYCRRRVSRNQRLRGGRERFVLVVFQASSRKMRSPFDQAVKTHYQLFLYSQKVSLTWISLVTYSSGWLCRSKFCFGVILENLWPISDNKVFSKIQIIRNTIQVFLRWSTRSSFYSSVNTFGTNFAHTFFIPKCLFLTQLPNLSVQTLTF